MRSYRCFESISGQHQHGTAGERILEGVLFLHLRGYRNPIPLDSMTPGSEKPVAVQRNERQSAFRSILSIHSSVQELQREATVATVKVG